MLYDWVSFTSLSSLLDLPSRGIHISTLSALPQLDIACDALWIDADLADMYNITGCRHFLLVCDLFLFFFFALIRERLLQAGGFILGTHSAGTEREHSFLQATGSQFG